MYLARPCYLLLLCLLLLAGFSECLIAGEAISPNQDPFPITKTKKGLQVQMHADALQLGVEHAALNLDLTRMIAPQASDGPAWEIEGITYHFNPVVVTDLDQRVQSLSDEGVVVYLILLTYASGEQELDRIMLHPGYAKGEKHTGPIAMFNLTTPESARWLQACMEFLAHRYSSEQGHGRVWGYISGNEVNSHWHWANMGQASAEQVVDIYEQSTRLIHDAVRKYSAHARVYLSLDHCWGKRYAVGNDQQCIGGREFLNRFAQLARSRGDFDWHVAYHPYPEPLTDPRFWRNTPLDRQVAEAPVVTFRNLEVLCDFLNQPELQFDGKSRSVILSEQGFHCVESRPTGEQEQAAAYALAYKKVASLPQIEAFILHRHTDHAHEGGLKLGLWTNKTGEICTPDRPRLMYNVFQKAGTSQEEAAFEFALPVIGSASWEEALQKLSEE